MQTPVRESSLSASRRRFNPGFLIVAAAILHVSLTLTVFAIGRYQLAPSQVYSTGIGKFASDGIIYESQVVELSKILKSDGVRAWATWPTQLHVRLYSIPLAMVSRWISFNILTIEPLNLIYYLAILVLVFKIGEVVLDYRSGLIAATIVALWPSFLLHSTQLLRDPLLILSVLVLVWSVVQSLRRELSWRRGLLLGFASVAAIVSIRIVRLPMWYVIVAAVAGAAALLVVRAVQSKHFPRGATAFALLIIVAVAITPKFQPFFHNQQESQISSIVQHEELQKLSLDEQIALHRDAFKWKLDADGEARPAEDGSRIDADVSLHSAGEIIRHVPRAIVVGFLAPFPNMWLRSGKQVGYSGRVIAGIEMLMTYLIEFLALLGLWSARKNLSAWFLVIVIGLGATALGLVVNNMGAMYRLRYPFWVLIVILGAGGICFLFGRFRNQRLDQVDNSSAREVYI
ncbi:MAG TPA: hypothetical protein DC054_17960 [Blastocatellia bacterium]|nr:hypothetical protein [Blastocatellia bacterium]